MTHIIDGGCSRARKRIARENRVNPHMGAIDSGEKKKKEGLAIGRASRVRCRIYVYYSSEGSSDRLRRALGA